MGSTAADGTSGTRSAALAGMALIGAAALGLLSANSPLSELYARLLVTPVEVRVGFAALAKPLLLWVNDGLMAIFFLLVALELKREVLEGELSQLRQVVLPLMAAIGGILVPAGIFVLFNRGDSDALRGWAIPSATDIAFALGVLAMLGSRVPVALKAFLLSVAVFDDIGAILIIAAFYTGEISWTAKGWALGAAACLFLLNRLGVRRIGVYVLAGIVLWVCVLKSGVHATLAGVLLGLMIPHRPEGSTRRSPLLDLEHAIHPWVAFLIVPVFAFANAGVSLSGSSSVIADPVALGIIFGLVGGKLVGVFGFAWLAIRLGIANLPAGATWISLGGVSLLAGVGFTMSLFIGTLAFEQSTRDFVAPLRVGVLAGSLIAAISGYFLLRTTARAAQR